MHRRRVKAIGVCDIVGAPEVGALSRRPDRLDHRRYSICVHAMLLLIDSLGDEVDCPTRRARRVRWRLGMMVRGAYRRSSTTDVPLSRQAITDDDDDPLDDDDDDDDAGGDLTLRRALHADGWRRSLDASIPRCTSARVVVVILGGGSGAVVRWALLRGPLRTNPIAATIIGRRSWRGQRENAIMSIGSTVDLGLIRRDGSAAKTVSGSSDGPWMRPALPSRSNNVICRGFTWR